MVKSREKTTAYNTVGEKQGARGLQYLQEIIKNNPY
jgi:hypothetical protein